MKYVHDSILQEALSLKQCIDLPLQFPKFRLVRCFTLSFYDTGLQTGHQIKEVTDWNVYQENNTSIGSQEGGGGGVSPSPALSQESILVVGIYGLNFSFK